MTLLRAANARRRVAQACFGWVVCNLRDLTRVSDDFLWNSLAPLLEATQRGVRSVCLDGQ